MNLTERIDKIIEGIDPSQTEVVKSLAELKVEVKSTEEANAKTLEKYENLAKDYKAVILNQALPPKANQREDTGTATPKARTIEDIASSIVAKRKKG